MASACIAVVTLLTPQARAFTFEIDYRYDLANFFSAEGNPQGAAGAAQARANIAAAAARFAAIIDSKLLPAEFNDDRDDPRIRFVHPGTGQPIEVSSATSRATDALLPGGAAPAAEYRGPWSIPADTYILYPGAYRFGDGSSGTVEAVGNSSTGFGENFNEIIDGPDSPINRGFPHPFRNGPRDNLPVWGGSISFTTHENVDWHFDHTTTPGVGGVDFYSVVLHEIAHVLGINTSEWNNWRGHIEGFNYTGPEGIAALRADNNGTANPEIASGLDPHWFGQTALSKIFPAGSPNYAGTVGTQAKQRSIMYGTLAFSFPELLRFEITNLDAACLRDTGWSTISGDVPDPIVIDTIDFDITPGAAPSLSWIAPAGTRFTIFTSTNLRDWLPVTPDIISDEEITTWEDGQSGFQDPTPPASQVREKYYRLMIQPAVAQP